MNSTMMAVVTTRNCGYDKLAYKKAPIPKLEPDEILIQALAAGVNNTEINTHLGWYTSSVKTSTESASDQEQQEATQKADAAGIKPHPSLSSKAQIVAGA